MADIISRFAVYTYKAIEAYLDLCCGREGIPLRPLDRRENSHLFKLLRYMGSIEKEPKVLDSQTTFFSWDSTSSFRFASNRKDHAWGAKCLRHLGSAEPEPMMEETQASDVLSACNQDWRDNLIDLLFEEHNASDPAFNGLDPPR